MKGVLILIGLALSMSSMAQLSSDLPQFVGKYQLESTNVFPVNNPRATHDCFEKVEIVLHSLDNKPGLYMDVLWEEMDQSKVKARHQIWHDSFILGQYIADGPSIHRGNYNDAFGRLVSRSWYRGAKEKCVDRTWWLLGCKKRVWTTGNNAPSFTTTLEFSDTAKENLVYHHTRRREGTTFTCNYKRIN